VSIEQRLFALSSSRWTRRLLALVLLLLYTGWIGYVIIRDKPVDFNLYYMAAYGFAHGYDVYDASTVPWAQIAQETHISNYAPPYRYPPLTAMLVWPLTFLTPRWAAVAFLVASAAAAIVAAWLLGRVSPLPYGMTLALGLLLCYIPPLTTMHAGQVNCLVLLALALSFYGLSCNHPVLAGVGAAVGAMLKLVPIAHTGYLGWRRQWQALVVSLVTLVVLVALAIPFTSWAGLVSYGRHILLLGEAGGLIPIGSNQSITGFFARVLLAFVPSDIVRWLSIGTTLALVAATVVLCWPRRSSAHLIPLEFALITVAINLITPYVWYHQFVLLFIPFFVLAEQALSTPHLRWMLIPLAVGYVLTNLHGLIWHSLDPYPLLVSMPFYTALLLWGCLAWLIVRGKSLFHKAGYFQRLT